MAGSALTDTAGIQGLDTTDHDTALAAFLFLQGKDATRVLVAAEGLITLTRLDGKEEIVEGNLAFAEVSEAGMARRITGSVSARGTRSARPPLVLGPRLGSRVSSSGRRRTTRRRRPGGAPGPASGHKSVG